MKQLSVVGTLCAAMAGLLGSGSAQAALVDRGGGMLYDTVLNITWLQDANYARTSNYDADGRMNWRQANTWANNLEYGGYSDWRLARNSPVNGTRSGWNYSYPHDGTKDVGYNITSTLSELSYMYYVNLGLKSAVSPNGEFPWTEWGIFGNGTTGGQNDVGLVKNIQSYAYWSGTAFATYPNDMAWFFDTRDGLQSYDGFQSTEFFASWAVRPGDVTVAAVPVPGSVALLAGGLALLGAVTRRRGRLVEGK